MNLEELYCERIIKPIEEERNRLREKVYSKNILNIIMKDTYKKQLNKHEDLLMNCYKVLEEILNNE